MITLATLAILASATQDAPPVNFDDHIRPIMQEYCIGCHRGSRARNGFKAGSLTELLEGGSSGAGLVPGDPGNSLLYQLVARQREPFMPYEDDPLPAEHVETIRVWIEAGAPENASSKRMEPKQIAVADMPTVTTEAVAVMPDDNTRRNPHWWSSSPGTVTTLATAPRAPLLAVGGQRQVVLYHLETYELLGVLDFPEGAVHALRFSPHGSVLIAGGGRGGDSGVVVGWDVATAERLFSVGNEPDVVLAADITNDHRLVAMGGPDRIVRVYLVETGDLLYEIGKHTDWITAVQFSPDGVLLATGDRTGGLFVWEADTGREFHELPVHRGRVSSLGWRTDSMVLASAGEDGGVRLYEMENGGQLRAWTSHGGVLSMAFDTESRLATCGRDRHARMWDTNAKQLVQVGPLADLATSVAIRHDTSRLIVGGWAGEVQVYDTSNGQQVATLAVNPPTTAYLAMVEAEAAVPTLETQLATLEQQASDAESAARVRADAASAAEQTRAAAEEQATILEQQAAALKTTADRARSESDALAAIVGEKQAAAESLAQTLQAARTEATRTHEEMLAAVQESVDAEAAGAADRLALARKLQDGATAIARQAAATVAGLEVDHAACTNAHALWATRAAPLAETARVTAEEHQQAHAAAVKARGDANAATSVLQTATSEMTAAGKTADDLGTRLATLRLQIDAARQHATASRTAWDTQRQAILEAGGKVP